MLKYNLKSKHYIYIVNNIIKCYYTDISAYAEKKTKGVAVKNIENDIIKNLKYVLYNCIGTYKKYENGSTSVYINKDLFEYIIENLEEAVIKYYNEDI